MSTLEGYRGRLSASILSQKLCGRSSSKKEAENVYGQCLRQSNSPPYLPANPGKEMRKSAPQNQLTDSRVASAGGGAGAYQFAFNGMEADDEVKGEGNGYDFGARIYDPRLGRFLSVDRMFNKYPDLSTYHFSGNNPIRFVDYDGNDFGVLVNHDNKSITIVANVYTNSRDAYAQAITAASAWNSASATVDGYTVTFSVKVMEPVQVSDQQVVKTFSTVDFEKRNGSLKRRLVNRYRGAFATNRSLKSAEADPIGNSFSGNDGPYSISVSGERFVGGQTVDGRFMDMNTHSEFGDLGENPDLVGHEFGHMFGLDDKDGDGDGHGDPYYPGDGGIMQYTGMDLNDISDGDIEMIVNYMLEKMSSEASSDDTEANVELIEEVGSSTPADAND